MSAPLDEDYFVWLYSRVASLNQRNKSKTHWDLLKHLYSKEFVWWVPNDDNRVEDGRNLRFEFLEDYGLTADDSWLELPCSMLEMLIGLSRRVSFEAGGKANAWFWHMLHNVELPQYTDARPGKPDQINEILDQIIWRTYRPDGVGGLFPLREPVDDQRKVELWYQLSAYIVEQL